VIKTSRTQSRDPVGIADVAARIVAEGGSVAAAALAAAFGRRHSGERAAERRRGGPWALRHQPSSSRLHLHFSRVSEKAPTVSEEVSKLQHPKTAKTFLSSR